MIRNQVIKKRVALLMLCALMISFLAGCSGGSKPAASSDSNQPVSTEPVTLKMFQLYAKVTDEDFKKFIADPVKAKYPNITIELVRGTADQVNQMIAAGDFPDMIYTGITSVGMFKDLGILADMNDLVKKNNFNLNDFEPNYIAEIKKFGSNGELYAIPYLENFSALFYNKDIFDKAGMAYPKDGMYWEDVIQMGKQLAAKQSGDSTASLCAGNFNQFSTSLGLPLVDPKTNKAVIDTDAWKKAAQTFIDINTIPGNKCGGDTKEVAAFENGTLAMASTNGQRISELEEMYNQGKTMNWDLVTDPQFKDAPGKQRQIGLFTLMISSLSKHKDQAFQAIMAISSKDQQIARTKSGLLSTFKDPEIKKDFAIDMKAVKGKNIQSIFKTEAASLPPYTPYNGLASGQLGPAVSKVIANKADLNSAFRDAEDLANKAIDNAKAAKQ